ncbi:hypothetical protein KVR01_012287 [Diaporthe batatas]|uniref:uncharacterized protein n=1 Tax=Diaporthe batatas TaxID=748121 RepID=UPI001D0506E0|nr:uncharacterized protein KVR01_012287 [Diaporthe batatas]KAG8158015.1 hypothetical protein KVR01_012287 [Diaporthe batatas]
MRSSTLILAAAGLTAAQDASSTCTDGLYMIVARATGEDPGTGRVGAVARNVSDAIPNSYIEPIVYPATFANYTTSEAAGVTAMTKAIRDRVAACPEGRIALLGFSQGAQVSADTLCGTDDGTGSAFPDKPDLGPEYERNIVAVIMFGDPSHSVDAPFNEGNATRNGIFARNNVTACEPYTSKMRSWCDSNDLYCDSGNSSRVHGSYFNNTAYLNDATSFVISQFKEGGSGSSRDNSTSNSTDSSTSSGYSLRAGMGQSQMLSAAFATACGSLLFLLL